MATIVETAASLELRFYEAREPWLKITFHSQKDSHGIPLPIWAGVGKDPRGPPRGAAVPTCRSRPFVTPPAPRTSPSITHPRPHTHTHTTDTTVRLTNMTCHSAFVVHNRATADARLPPPRGCSSRPARRLTSALQVQLQQPQTRVTRYDRRTPHMKEGVGRKT